MAAADVGGADCCTVIPLKELVVGVITDTGKGGSRARKLCSISPPRFLAECRKKRLSKASFVLLHFALFAFSGLCLVLVVCLFFLICRLYSCIFQRVPTRMALYNPNCADVPLRIYSVTYSSPF